MSIQYIQKGQIETLVIYPPHNVVASSPTIRFETPSTPIVDTGVNATIDSANGALSAAATMGDTTLSFASDPSFTSDRLYQLTDATTGASFRVKVVKSGTTTYLSDPLPMDIAINSTLVGIAITHNLTATETSDAGFGKAEITATANSATITFATLFKIISRQINYTLNAVSLVELEPNITRFQPDNDDNYNETITSSWRKYIYPELASRGYDVERILSWDILEPWHASACMVHVLVNNPSVDEQDKTNALEQMRGQGSNILGGNTDFWYDGGDSIGADTPPSTPRRGSTRVSR